MLKVALDHLDPALGPGRTVLDLGAAGGHMAAVFHAGGSRSLALDVDGVVLAAGRGEFPGPLRIAADMARIPVRTASVDALFAFSSIHYADDGAAVLEECCRVLRPGGRIAVVENLGGSPIVNLGRWLRAATRAPYRAHHEPRSRLAWSDRTVYERCFRQVRFDG